MRIIACMIWYDELPETLTESVRSLDGFADGLVALDGAFARFPLATDARPWSPPEQASAIAGAAGDIGIECVIYQPAEAGAWPNHRGNEVEKRNASVRMAGSLLGADWVFNHDGDMVLHAYGDARDRLDRTTCDVAMTDIEGTPTKNMYRYSPGLRHVHSHWLVVNERGVLSGPTGSRIRDRLPYGRMLRYIDLYDVLQFDHPERTDFWRRARQEAWYRVRNQNGIEDIPYQDSDDVSVDVFHPIRP